MTLITYPTRVHFADGVLEEALHSELDRIKSQRVLLVCQDSLAEGELSERIQSGMPGRASSEFVTIQDGAQLRDIALDVGRARQSPDTIVAFGSSQAIELGRKIRFAVDQSKGVRPTLFAVPGIDGLPDPCNRHLESKQAGLPSVVICDPTVIMRARQGDSLRAAVMSLTRCLEAYLSAGYNPPADGMALDGVSRSLTSLDQIGINPGLDLHREVMAAGLNAFLSQEKGVGPAQTMTAHLSDEVPRGQKAAIARLVLPGVMRSRALDENKVAVLRKVLSGTDEPLAESTRRILAEIKMPSTLADIGVPLAALDPAAKAVSGYSGLTFQSARSVLEEVYEGA